MIKNKNYLLNGNFSTGDFSHWRSSNNHTPMSVELRDFNYVARMTGGKSLGQNLASDVFETPAGPFTFSFNVQAPEAYPLANSDHQRVHITGAEGKANPLVNAFVLYTVWATSPIDQASEIWHGMRYVGPKSQVILIEGILPSGFRRVDVHLAIPSDPFGNKGSYYVDNIKFLMLAE